MCEKFLIALRGILVVLIVMLFVSIVFAASNGKIIHSFDATDGGNPEAGLIFDAAGNLYGTAYEGGPNRGGAVFELTPNGDGTWTEKVLYSFSFTNGDGLNPRASVVFDAAGNLYGTTVHGGSHGYGIVFELSPNGDGNWAEQVVYSFRGGTDGSYPLANLILDAAGNLYGTTQLGGGSNSCNGGCGTVFELIPQAGGGWAESILLRFNGTNGAIPDAGLIFDAAGNLYGTTVGGGAYHGGTVFRLRLKAGGGWSEMWYSFNTTGTSGYAPQAGVIFDTAGNLFGTTTAGGGAKSCGTIFAIRPKTGGGLQEGVLHRFDNKDGCVPLAGLVLDAAGNLYGTTAAGGAYFHGTVFQLTHQKGGPWQETVLHSFDNHTRPDGFHPFATLILDGAGNLYGTTQSGGADGYGMVFELTP